MGTTEWKDCQLNKQNSHTKHTIMPNFRQKRDAIFIICEVFLQNKAELGIGQN